MNGCPIRRGFFSLRECDQLPVHLCMTCGRTVCGDHSRMTAAGSQCVQCAAGAQPDGNPDDRYDSGWGYGYRTQYYRSSGYVPIGTGSDYDDRDYRSVEGGPAAASEIDDSEHGLDFLRRHEQLAMRLLWITENYYPGRGGMAQSCDRIVRALRACGVIIDLVHFVAGSQTEPHIDLQSNGRYIGWPVGHDAPHAMNLLWNWIESDSLRSGCTHVVAFGGLLPMQAAPVYAAWLNLPLVTLLRGNDFDAAVFAPRRNEMLREALTRAAAVCVVTREKAEKIRKLYPDARPVWIPNGIDLTDWEPLPSHLQRAAQWRQGNVAEGRRVLGMIGQIKQKKGGLFFLESLIESGCADRSHFVLVGDVAPEILVRLAEQQSVAYSVIPFTDRYDLLAWYAACDLIVLPSFYDGLPNVLLEAAALGIPLLTSRAGGMNDLLDDGVTGFLFAPGDREECRHAIARAFAAEDLSALGKAGRSLVRTEYSEGVEAERYLEVFHNTAGIRPNSGGGA